jgi:hypothetical protein
MLWGRAILAATTNKKMIAHPRNMAAAKQSTAATFRNIPAHNAIVIMQTTQTLCHKQRKRDNTNNASVITAKHRAHNAIVISQSRGQAFVTLRNISSAYLSHKTGLYSTLALLCLYAHMRISLYRYMTICGKAHNENDFHSQELAGKIDQGPDTHLAGP